MFDAETLDVAVVALSRVSTRLSSSVGYRCDIVGGGESALFAVSILGGVAGCKHVSVSGTPSHPAGLSSGDLEVLKA